MEYPFGINKTRAEHLLAHEVRTSHGAYRGGKSTVYLLWKSVVAKYQLTIFIDSAKNLAKKDFFGLSDPYVKISFRGPVSVFPHFTTISNDPVPDFYKTKTIQKTLNPYWNSGFKFSISGTEGTIIFDCYDENVLIPDDFLGRVYFTFNLTDPSSPYYVAVQPFGEDRGLITDYVLEEKYQNDVIDRVPYLRDIKTNKIRKTHKNHKIKGKLKMRILFEERTCWDDLIASYGPHFGYQHETDDNLAEPLTLESAGNPSQLTTQNEESDDEFEELPAGWEERIDSNRRRVYINHDTRMVSLQRPRQEQLQDSTIRTFLPRMHSVEEEEEDEDGWLLVTSPAVTNADVFTSDIPTTATTSFTTSVTVATTTTSSSSNTLTATSTATTATVTTATISSSSTTTLTATSTATTATATTAATISSSTTTTLTAATTQDAASAATVTQSTNQVNETATTEDLPLGWEKRTTKDGKIFFIDHNTRSTSWTHPNKTLQQIDSATASVHAEVQDDSLPPGWETRRTSDGKLYYIDHNTRTTTWVHPGKSQIPLPLGWEAREHSDGRIFYIDHNTKSTQWVDPRLELKNKPTAKIEYDRNYRQKYINFRTKLKQKPNVPNEFKWTVSRSSILEDSYNAIMAVSNAEFLKSRLYVIFRGESGLDYGGLAREWFHLLSHEMFSPYYGLFEYSASDDYTLQINPDSGLCNENHLQYFKFVGRVCGMAVYHAKLIDAFFIRPFYKMMLGKKIVLNDMQCVDVEFYNSLKYILDNDPEPLCLRFTATRDHYGEVTEIELKPGGSTIAVTESNRKEYVDLMLKWRFKDRIQTQMDAFLNGFSQIIPLRVIKVFDEKELEYLMGGLAEIDVEDWKRNTEYNNYLSTEQPIVWFWKAVETFDNETRARLLQFVTGTSKVPMNGFSELQGSNGPKKFTIKKYGAIDSLPCSHTCFNRIDLPPYKSYYELKEKLKLAVDNTEGFEIE